MSPRREDARSGGLLALRCSSALFRFSALMSDCSLVGRPPLPLLGSVSCAAKFGDAVLTFSLLLLTESLIITISF